MTYQIIDWQIHFENDRSKTRNKCSFVCVPNKQHGMGFSYIMAEKDGAMIYGIWAMILGACSQQTLPRNGWLTSDGTEKGDAWTAGDLATKFRRPVSEVKRALEVLSSKKIGWLSQVVVNQSQGSDSPPTHREVTADSPPTHLEEKRREEKGSEEEGNGNEPLPSPIPNQARIVLHLLNEQTGKHFRETETSLTPIIERMSEPDVTLEGVKLMVKRQVAMWKDSEMAEYLRPETLFGKTKFNSYYAAKDLPPPPERGKKLTISANHEEGF